MTYCVSTPSWRRCHRAFVLGLRSEMKSSTQSSRNAGQDAAAFLRRLLGLGDGPAFSLQGRLELEAGLRVFMLKMPATVSAVLIWSDQVGACVALNRDHPHERRRWSLLHELGHFLRDREAGDVLPF